MKEQLVFNRVLGLKFLYDNFPYYFSEDRIKLYFVNGKTELLNLNFDDTKYNTLLLKRSGNNKACFYSDIKCKDNRFFNSLRELKKGVEEFSDEFDFCVECHKFKKGESYYSDRLAIAQFSTEKTDCICTKISFIPAYKPNVNTRDNKPYLMLEFPYDYAGVFKIVTINTKLVEENGFGNYEIAYVVKQIHKMVENIKEHLQEISCKNTFQLIIRIDKNLNLLPIDFRTPEAWVRLNKK